MNGSLNPITIFTRMAVDYFAEYGYEILESPEIVSEWLNFDALNVPADHPARDVQDTFYLTDGKVMRTHTSSGQVPGAKKRKLPIKFVVPGTCYRNEATDNRHENTLYQMDVVCIDLNINLGHLFWTLREFLKEMFGSDIEVRFRPHHYSFVEPGVDVDMKFKNRWLEVLGSGMIHPTVLKNMGQDPKKVSGFAFGMGIDRLAMIKWNIDEIRMFRSGDLRFLKQFK